MRYARTWTAPLLVPALLFGACAEEEPAEEVPIAEVVEPVGREEGTWLGLDQWDEDRSATLARGEFGPWLTRVGVFGAWDGDRDLRLDDTELADGVFGVWDVDGDGRVTEDEFTGAAENWFDDRDFGTFAEWDLDGDESLGVEDVTAGLEREGLLGAWDLDGDGTIGEEEFATGVFDVFDIGDDELIDQAEWGAEYHAWVAVP